MEVVREILEKAAASSPEKRALLADGRTLDYGHLESLVEETAGNLHSIGVKKTQKVAILSPNSVDWLVLQLAVAELGAVLVPLNTRFKQRELSYILKQSDASVALVAERAADGAYFGIFAELFPGLKEAGHNRVESLEFPSMKHVIGDWSRTGLLDSLHSASAGRGKGFSKSDPDDIVLMQYTSGTTSFPKGVMLAQGQVIRNAYNLGERVGLVPEDELFSPLPFAHVGGSVLTNLLAVTHSSGIITMGRYEPESAIGLIVGERPTAINGIDSHFIDLYTNAGFNKETFPEIEKGWMVGPPEVVRNVIEKMGITKMTNVYGLSEASPNVTSSLETDSREIRCKTHGKTYPGMQVRIVDPDSGDVLVHDASGEIQVKGYSVMKGYYNLPRETAAAIDLNGWLHTGDRGHMNQEGYLIFEGRMKDVIRVGGENVSALEVEDVLLSNPKVKLVAVVGASDERLGEVCWAYVKLKDGTEATKHEIIDFCRERMASFKVPRVVEIVEKMPMTESGKIQKFKLMGNVAAQKKVSVDA